jgi:hypothetical protein
MRCITEKVARNIVVLAITTISAPTDALPLLFDEDQELVALLVPISYERV